VTAVSDDEVLDPVKRIWGLFYLLDTAVWFRHRRPGWISPAGVFFCSEERWTCARTAFDGQV